MARKKTLSEEKVKRIVVATTVACVLLVLFLVVVLICQLVAMGQKSALKEQLNEEKEQLESMLEEDRKDLDYYLTWDGLYRLARKQGWSANE